ncbi:MAG TPA: hypothetical protein VKV73_17715 [Chloroflexota bacterium]|nr:hypothetical protein [Chloroflexota bacterium]
MTGVQLYRLSGGALLVGMILSVVSIVLSGVLFPDSSNVAAATNPLNITLSLIGVVGTFVSLVGLPGMAVRGAGERGLVWLIGVVLIALTGMLFGLVLGLMSVIVFPALATRAPDVFGQGPPPAFFGLFLVGTIANVLGAILMAIPVLTKHLYPRWCGYLLVIEALLGVAGFIVSGPSASPIAQILNVAEPLPLFVVLGWAGYELWTGRAPASEAVSRSVVAQSV